MEDNNSVLDLLRSWGLKAESIAKFTEQDISKDLLRFVDENLLDRLRLTEGQKLCFKLNQQKYFSCEEGKDVDPTVKLKTTPKEQNLEKAAQVLAFADDDNNIFVQQNLTCDAVVLELDDTLQSTHEGVNDITAAQDKYHEPNPKITHRGSNPVSSTASGGFTLQTQVDVRSVLLRSVKGVILVNKYKTTTLLTPDEQDFVVERIIDHELENDLDKQITGDRFIYLADQIIQVFPKECRAIYIVINEEGKFVAGKGKLYRRWSNCRRKLAEAGLLSINKKIKRGEKRKRTEEAASFATNCSSSLEALKNISHPWETVEECWKNSVNVRLPLLETGDLQIDDYLSQFPAFKVDKAYSLLEIDFQQKYPEKSLNLYTHWPRLEKFLVAKLFKSAESGEETSDFSPHSLTNRVIGNISHVFNPITVRKRSKNSPEWKPSRLEIQQSIFLHVKVLADIDTKIANRVKQLQDFKSTLQPFAVLVGLTLDNISQTFVYLTETRRYEVDTPLKALDVLFKSFFALNAQYPIESGQVWLFLQRVIWKIPRNPLYDKNHTRVEALISEFAQFEGMCDATLVNIDDLLGHLTNSHPEYPKNEYICGEVDCHRVFDNKTSFKHHLFQKHQKGIEIYDTDCASGLVRLNHSSNISNDDDGVFLLNDPEPKRKISPQVKNVNFEGALKSTAAEFVSKLYANKRLPRNIVQKIINDVEPFFGESLLGILESRVMNILLKSSECDSDSALEIRTMFTMLRNPFRDFSSEYKCMKYIESTGNYIAPQSYEIKRMFLPKIVNGIQKSVRTAICGQFIPLQLVLKKLFELPHALQDTLNYMNSLETDNPVVIKNFIQCDLWRSKRSKYKPTDIVLPLFINSDDVETNNPLGSHSGKLTAVYASIPCLPPECRSLLENYFLVLLFESWIKKKLDDETDDELLKDLYKPLVHELIYLETEGIDICTPDGSKHVYFVLGLLLGDNLGIHQMLGMVESFSANYYCRFCKMHKTECRVATHVNPSLLRTVENYEEELSMKDPSRTGLKARCPFNEVPSFHALNNPVVDDFHDSEEGVKAYSMRLIISGLTSGEHKEFDLTFLSNRILMFDYGSVDQGNKPPVITQNDLRKYKLTMKGAEMACLVRYFGLIIGDLVSKQNPYWKLYILGRQIYDITSAKKMSREEVSQLPSLIHHHHELYKELSSSHIVPKFHFYLHYLHVFHQSGPIANLSCIRFEAKHRDVTAPASVTMSRVNIALTVAKKHQLKLSYRFMANESIIPSTSFGKQLPCLDQGVLQLLPVEERHKDLFSVRWVEFKGTTYKPTMALVTGTENLGLTFGIIDTILMDPTTDRPGFICTKLLNFGLDEHVWAYSVTPSNEKFYIKISELFDSFPLSMHAMATGQQYIVLRSSI